MWRNAEVLDFIGWLRAHNDAIQEGDKKVGFYGLDLYSLYASIEAVLGYLDKIDPEAAKGARYRYSCFDQFGENSQAYGYAATYDLTESCEREVVSEMDADLMRKKRMIETGVTPHDAARRGETVYTH
jgi:erythromycin esterase-like protein